MTRHFYTDPIAAAWMCKHFRMQIHANVWQQDEYVESRRPVPLWAWARKIEQFSKEECQERFYIGPECARLLEPKVGDLMRLYFYTPEEDDKAGAVMTGFYSGGQEAITWFRNPRDGSIDKEVHKLADHQWRIIQRNGVAFHWPETEES